MGIVKNELSNVESTSKPKLEGRKKCVNKGSFTGGRLTPTPFHIGIGSGEWGSLVGTSIEFTEPIHGREQCGRAYKHGGRFKTLIKFIAKYI